MKTELFHHRIFNGSRYSILRRIAFLVCCLLLQTSEASSLIGAKDLQAEAELANRLGGPLIILYSRHGCSYCEIVRRDYLLPLQNQTAERSNVLIRQINIDSASTLVDFSGKTTTHARFAAQQKIKLVPVVAFYGLLGQTLSAPIIGVRIPDFYPMYLENAIQESRK